MTIRCGSLRSSGRWGERTSFKTDSINRFVRDVRGVIKSGRPDAILYANNTGLAQNVTGCTIDGLFPYVDFIGTEGYNGPIGQDTRWRVHLLRRSQSGQFMEGIAECQLSGKQIRGQALCHFRGGEPLFLGPKHAQPRRNGTAFRIGGCRWRQRLVRHSWPAFHDGHPWRSGSGCLQPFPFEE